MKSYIMQVLDRALADGGFSDRQGGRFRPDATAWAIMVLAKQAVNPDILNAARNQLVSHQMPDGRVVISQDHLDALWPTPLAILAWHTSELHRRPRNKAVRFLLESTGVHWEKSDNDVVGHDTLIPGWPWIDQTHSWVAPTAMCMIALSALGYTDHARLDAGGRLLLDRQIPSGGWNYGNTSVLGKELRPFPETTGMALLALAGRVRRADVMKSVEYLRAQVPTLRTPLSLGWSILGLKAWHSLQEQANTWVTETLERGSLYGEYDTASLCVLLLASLAIEGTGGLVG